MEEIGTIFNNVGILVAALAGGISLVMFGFAGIQYMTAQGDPQGMSRAKMSVIGAVVGLAIAGLAFVMPGVISRLIIEPAGGENVAGNAVGDNCDQLLKNQLVFQRGASTAGRMQEVIRQIQAQRDSCVSELWNPQAVDSTAGSEASCPGTETIVAGTPPTCSGGGTYTPAVGASHASCASAIIDQQTVPRGLLGSGGAQARLESGRDSSNNIIVYFDPNNVANRPSDAAMCWMYVSRLNAWAEAY
ncbi:MAG: hypothetical protein F4X66_09070 [Chloroflexi bacterium]|nr:hypothetical protein [Chloroflexota bacterium]